MSNNVLKTISIRSEGGPVVDFLLTDKGIVKSKGTATRGDKCYTKKHKCDSCLKSFKLLTVFKKHLTFCHFQSGYQLRKAEMMKNIAKIEEEAMDMEKKNNCFCCGESYDTYHLGQINCPDCPRSFKTQMSYERHIFITHSESDDFPCSICNAKLRTPNLLKLHEEQHTSSGRLYACKICGKDFSRKYRLNYHQKYTSCYAIVNDTMTSQLKNKVFSRINYFRKHLKRQLSTQVKKKRKYMCPICKNNFQSVRNLKRHKRTHTGERPFACNFCEKKFLTLSELKIHHRYHSGEKPYTCTECNNSFAVRQALKVHMRRHTGEKPYACPKCNQSFAIKGTLDFHMKLHTGEKPYKCTECNQCFLRKYALHAHMRRHTGEKPYTCPECSQSFALNSTLITHMRRHTGEKPYTCNECGQCYSTKSSFNRHIKIHEKFQVLQCTQSFDLKNTTTLRMRRNNIEKPFTCHECSLCYATKSSLNRHMKTHYVCKECGLSFSEAASFDAHRKTHVSSDARDRCEEKEEELKTHYDMGVHKDTEKGQTDCGACCKEFQTIKTPNSHILEVHNEHPDTFMNSISTKGNFIKNNSTTNKKQASHEDSIGLQEFIKEEVPETSSDQLLLQNKFFTKIENEGTSLESKNTDSVNVSGVITNDRTSVKDGIAVSNFIKDEVPETTTEQFLINNDVYTIITLENPSIKVETETTPV